MVRSPGHLLSAENRLTVSEWQVALNLHGSSCSVLLQWRTSPQAEVFVLQCQSVTGGPWWGCYWLKWGNLGCVQDYNLMVAVTVWVGWGVLINWGYYDDGFAGFLGWQFLSKIEARLFMFFCQQSNISLLGGPVWLWASGALAYDFSLSCHLQVSFWHGVRTLHVHTFASLHSDGLSSQDGSSSLLYFQPDGSVRVWSCIVVQAAATGWSCVGSRIVKQRDLFRGSPPSYCLHPNGSKSMRFL